MSVQPNSVEADKSHGRTVLKVPVVMGRTANELDVLSHQCAELEAALLSFLPLTNSTDTRVALQSLDLIQQSLANLSTFLVVSSRHNNRDNIDATTSLASVKLGAMRARLMTGSDEE